MMGKVSMWLKCCIVPPAWSKVVSVLVFLHPQQRHSRQAHTPVVFVDFLGCSKISVQVQCEPFRDINAAYRVSNLAVKL